jgi:hypothetical protein
MDISGRPIERFPRRGISLRRRPLARSRRCRSARGSATEPEEVPLGIGWRHGGGALVCGRGLAVSAEPPEQIGSGGMEGLVVVQVQFVDQSERCRGAVNLADRDGAVEGHDRRGGERKQVIVKGDDLRPVGLFECGSVCVHGVDGVWGALSRFPALVLAPGS